MSDTRIPLEPAALKAWMVDYITSIIDIPAAELPTDQTFTSYGLDSVEAVVMAGVLEEEFGVPVDPASLFEHPSIDAFVAAFATEPA
ncbi:acyl carrier protein [Sphingomonas sp. ID0503]|uniref:acyl carrier protein n=1 Tax=Sphingomonas sp. ID0503 TaxID=3399691 RepID=UPI003AFAF1B8